MDSMNRAAESSPEAGEALKQAQAEAKKQAKAEQEASLEKVRRQKAAEAKEENRAPAASPPADTIEISAEGRKFSTKLFKKVALSMQVLLKPLCPSLSYIRHKAI
ncbi:hypothetical protein BK140_32685 [Paenibacillus macerans]|nr:hypothetical protein BK140_32685 [Paenibacillus macerans]